MYVGVTSNLPARVAAHRAGRGSEHVAENGLNRLVWAEQTEDSLDAIAHENGLNVGVARGSSH